MAMDRWWLNTKHLVEFGISPQAQRAHNYLQNIHGR